MPIPAWSSMDTPTFTLKLEIIMLGQRIEPFKLTAPKSILAITLFMVSGTTMANPDFDISNESEYQTLLSSMRAAEYVRADSIHAQSSNARIFASVAGLMAFAEINPAASATQLAAFVDLYHTALSETADGDPSLSRPEHLIQAIQFTQIQSTQLDGLDTRVGNRVMELLGMRISDPDGFESIQRRMVQYESSIARRVNHNRTEVFDLLVQGFFGQDPSGNDRPGLTDALSNFLINQGFDPALGAVREDRSNVEAGLSILPQSFAEYQSAIIASSANQTLQLEIQNRLQSVSDRISGLLDQIAQNADNPVGNGIDATQAEVDAMFAQLQLELEANNEARAATSAATLIMLQSEFDDIGTYASYTRDYSSISLESSDSFALAQASVDIANNLTNIFIMADDGASIIDNTFSLVSNSIGLASVFSSGPSVDEQIFEQIVELRQQVEDLRNEMNERFDRIDQQLNLMFDTFIAGFNALGDEIGDLQTEVDGLVLDMTAVRSQLRRIEASLYGVAEDILLTDLTNEANVVLDYRDENGVDLPYQGGNPNFISASESFFTYANVTALSEAFAGSRSNPTLIATNADEIVGSGPIARRLNDLAVLPQSLGLPALSSTELVGIEPWSQASSAYAQLARENPWYFAYRYGRQLEDYNSDPKNESLPELDRTILSGERVISLIESIRDTDEHGKSELFDALVAQYKSASADLQDEIDDLIRDSIPSYMTDGNTTLDFWGNDGQNISALLPTLTIQMHRNDGTTYEVGFNSSVPAKGYLTLSSTTGNSLEQLQIWHLLQNPAANTDIRLHGQIDRSTTRFGEGVMDVWLGNENWQEARHRRVFTFNAQFRLFNFVPWQQLSLTTEAQAEQVYFQGWATSGLRDQYPTSLYSTPTNSVWTSQDNLGRINVTTTYQNSDFTTTVSEIKEDFYFYRNDIMRPIVQNALFNENSPVAIAAERLDNTVALINAYVTIGMSKELNDSDPLRSALRGIPGTSEFGLRKFDVISLISQFGEQDSAADWADTEYTLANIQSLLDARVDQILAEIEAGLQRPVTAPGYVEYTLAELEHLREYAFDLAIDDQYQAETDGSVTADPITGLLANDITQEFTGIAVDTAFEFDPMYVAPQSGQLTIQPDGSFTYQADPGFIGTDRFTYRATTILNGTSNIVYSDPATVRIVVENPSCNGADLAEPFGVLDFFDISEFLTRFSEQDPVADLNNDGLYDFFDVSDLLNEFDIGCP